jgi:hypothetical protein
MKHYVDHYEALCRLMVQESLVSSVDEALALVDSMIEEHEERSLSTEGSITCLLCDYFNLSIEDSVLLVQEYFPFFENVEAPLDGDNVVSKSIDFSSDSDNNSDEVIGPGDCDLCERGNIRLTRHHLIPKCTWRRTESMILALWMGALEGKNNNDEFHELHHLLPEIDALAASVPACQTARGRQAAPGKRIIRDVLTHQTIDICRSCHDHIHRTHDNRTLSFQYNTLEKLLEDPCISKYARWAHHQKSKALSHEEILPARKSKHRFKK